jgi:polyisoprenoid-binding protein YceI
MIKMRVIKWWMIAILSIGWGAEQLSAEDLSRKFYFSNFDQAEKSSNYLRFDMKSTNVWILNNNFHGFVKDFAIDIRGLEKGSISKVHLSFDVTTMDTDNRRRNKKMHDYCLAKKDHPQIVVDTKSPIAIDDCQHKVLASINVRGKEKQIELDLKVKKSDKRLGFSGMSPLDLSKLEIPKPSIFLAKVKDQVNVSFVFDISLR